MNASFEILDFKVTMRYMINAMDLNKTRLHNEKQTAHEPEG